MSDFFFSFFFLHKQALNSQVIVKINNIKKLTCRYLIKGQVRLSEDLE